MKGPRGATILPAAVVPVPEPGEPYAGRNSVSLRESHPGPSGAERTELAARGLDAADALQGGRSVRQPPTVQDRGASPPRGNDGRRGAGGRRVHCPRVAR